MVQRYSKKREAILAAIRSTKTHPSAEWVYEKLKPEFPGLSLGTVYRNIAEFRRDGLLTSVGVVDDRERFDADVSPHGHFICDRCGAVLDAELDADKMPELCGDAAGADITRCEVTFHGLCKKCVQACLENK